MYLYGFDVVEKLTPLLLYDCLVKLTCNGYCLLPTALTVLLCYEYMWSSIMSPCGFYVNFSDAVALKVTAADFQFCL